MGNSVCLVLGFIDVFIVLDAPRSMLDGSIKLLVIGKVDKLAVLAVAIPLKIAQIKSDFFID
jgi:hypothetical protein